MKREVTKNETAESQNFNFVQVSRAYMREIRALTKSSPLAAEILFYLVENMGVHTNAVVCSYATLQEVTATSRASVGRAIKLLKDERWLETVKIGSATAYAVNASVFWQAARNQKHYAIFQATVVAAQSEQPSDFHLKAKKPLKHIPIIADARPVVNPNESIEPPDQHDLDLD